VVLSVVLRRRDDSPRWKEEVAHPSPAHWMHHLEIHDVVEIDDEMAGWLRVAADRAGCAVVVSKGLGTRRYRA
jgi:hypothetical protein